MTDIPARATPREVSGYRQRAGRIWLRTVEYRLGREVVGRRFYDAGDHLVFETSLREGRAHGRTYEFFDGSGAVSCVERYTRGLLHGTCYQWDEGGRLIGRYVLRHGTGWDVWRDCRADGRVFLAEVRSLRAGLRHGFEWWLSGHQLGSEAHFVDGKRHGIERSWSAGDRLERGYPRYWVADARVTKRQYLTAARTDSSLPPFRERDNRAGRGLPKTARATLAKLALSGASTRRGP